MTDISVKRVPKSKLRQEIDDNVVAGWKLKSENENLAILTKGGELGSGAAHLLIFLLFGWWTICIANLLYAGYKYMTTKKELQIKADLE